MTSASNELRRYMCTIYIHNQQMLLKHMNPGQGHLVCFLASVSSPLREAWLDIVASLGLPVIVSAMSKGCSARRSRVE